MTLRLSLIIPAHNESQRLGAGYERVAPVLAKIGAENFEVIVIDDGSSDDTLSVAGSLYGHFANTLFLRQPVNLGKGAAIRLGMSVARGTYVIAADADMAIDPEYFEPILKALSNAHVAPGSRTTEGAIRYESSVRTWAGALFNRIVRHYIKTSLRDTQCGCKGYQTGAGRLLSLLGMVDGFAFDAEVFYLAGQLGLHVKPVHVTWKDVAGSKVRVGRDSLRMLKDMRGLKKTPYQNPVVELPADVDKAALADAAKKARVQGLVLARGETNALCVLPRDGSLGGLGIAASLKGTLRLASLSELRSRTYEAV